MHSELSLAIDFSRTRRRSWRSARSRWAPLAVTLAFAVLGQPAGAPASGRPPSEAGAGGGLCIGGPSGGGVADLRVSKSVPTELVAPGTHVTFRVEVANCSTLAATTMAVNDALPAELGFVSVQQTAGPTPDTSSLPPVGQTGGLAWTWSSFPGPQTAVFEIETVALASTAGAQVVNTASVFWDGTPPGSTFFASSAAGLVIGTTIEVPTLGEIGLVALALLLVAGAWTMLRRG